MKLSILIPVYNEEDNIEKVISMVRHAPIEIAKEIIIIDDGSTDQTREILAKYRNDREIKLIFQPKNMGKGMAIRTGLREAAGDVILIQDADLEYSVENYPEILKPIFDRQAKVVYGSRFKGKISGMHWPNWLANKILTWTANILYGIWITDEATAYKVFEAKVIQNIPLKCERFEFCPEITAKVAKRGYKIAEVPIVYHGRDTASGKKIKFQDGFVAFWTLVKYRFKD